MTALLAAALAVGVAPFAHADGNRLLNGGAEVGDLSGWQVSGWRVAAYGESLQVPSMTFGTRHRLGARLFAAEPGGGSMTQTIALDDLAERVDRGEQRLLVLATLGAAAGRQDAPSLSVQALDRDSRPLEAPFRIGPPTVADLGGQTVMVGCAGFPTVPPGTRSAVVTLEAPGASTATADDLYVSEQDRLAPADLPLVPGPNGWLYGQQGGGEGPGCNRWVPVIQPPPPAPVPAPGAGQLPGLKVTSFALTTRQIKLKVSRTATLRVTIQRRARRLSAGAGSVASQTWATVRRFTLKAPGPGSIVRTISRLAPGRYRIMLREAVAGAKTSIRTRTIRAP